MPYRFLEEEATADIAFEATGGSLEELFAAAAEATLNVMIECLDSIQERETREFRMQGSALDLLLFDLLQELIFFKDAHQLLLRVREIQIERQDSHCRLTARCTGEMLDPERHQQRVDVKAVTLHRFHLEETGKGWRAHVILDI